MTFLEFAASFGLILNNPEMGKWVAVPTVDHPRKRNGRYKFIGDRGWVQNWATMTEPSMWTGQCDNINFVRRVIAREEVDRKKLQEKAAKKAGWILHQCVRDTHPYLEGKGFPEEQGNVWPEHKLLAVPMRIAGRLVGVQLIDHQGEKRFLHGQVTKGASFTFDAGGLPIFVEGLATGLSVRAAMQAMKLRYQIHICFSAGNLQHVARSFERGLIVADNDLHGVGERAARDTGHPYWISPTRGQDFNDLHQDVGLFRAATSLRRMLHPISAQTRAPATTPAVS
jgi:phage/plasmid primase-like uncharacterized protein